jgi:hypothetical protein
MATTAISEKMTTNAENVNMLFFMGFLVLVLWLGEEGGEGAVGVVIDGGDLDGFA